MIIDSVFVKPRPSRQSLEVPFICFVVATFLLVTGHVLPGLLNLELQLAMSSFNFLIRPQLLLSEFNLACAQLRLAEYYNVVK